MTEVRYYAGIGSRETPAPVLVLIGKIASKLAAAGYVVRSGGAPGADEAFVELLRPHQTEVYLPWPGFNEFDNENAKLLAPTPEAYDHAAQFHPSWKFLRFGGKKLIARDSHQILGPDIANPVYSEFVICWTKKGKEVGGTAQAIRIANSLKIPVYNLGNDTTYNLLAALV